MLLFLFLFVCFLCCILQTGPCHAIAAPSGWRQTPHYSYMRQAGAMTSIFSCASLIQTTSTSSAFNNYIHVPDKVILASRITQKRLIKQPV